MMNLTYSSNPTKSLHREALLAPKQLKQVTYRRELSKAMCAVHCVLRQVLLIIFTISINVLNNHKSVLKYQVG